MSKYFKKGACSVMDIVYPGKKIFIPRHIYEMPSTGFKDYLDSMPDLDYICVKPGSHRQYIADVTCGFDIETTQVNAGEMHEAFMYVWQLNFADVIVKGRTWEDWHECMAMIQNRFPELGVHQMGKRNSDTRQILMAIANNGFEFQFFGKQLYHGKPIVNSVFADEKRSPITIDLSWGTFKKAFKVIDALRIGSPSLKALAKDYCFTRKMTGDLDYDIPRNSKTRLTRKEHGYIDNDVIILAEYMRYYLDSYVKQAKLVPITKTGICRAAVAHEFLKRGENPVKLYDMFPDTYAEYAKIMTRLYRGGYTHANAYNVGVVHENVHGMDFTSSYPAVLTNFIECKYPIDKFKEIDVPDVDTLDGYADANDVCWYATFEFEQLNATTFHSIESIAKIEEFFQNSKNSAKTVRACGICADNGRILAAQKMTVMLTEQDWINYRKFYIWKNVKVTGFHVSKRGALPAYLVEVCKYFYKKKAELKRMGLSGTTAYTVAKQMVNALYGLCVQCVHVDTVKFDPYTGWTKQNAADMNAEYCEQVRKGKFLYDKQGNIKEPQYWLPPQYGIWITAHARRRILEAIHYLGNDAIYSDTDSVYFKTYEQHKEWFENWNKRIESENQQVFGKDFDTCGDLGTFDPVCIEWEENHKKRESEEYSFKTWGAKRYIKIDSEGHMEQTIAGLPKGVVLDSIKKKHPEWSDRECAINCFDVFKGDLEIQMDESRKLTTSYKDGPTERVVTDLQGNTETMRELSSVCLYKIPFKMTVERFYEMLVAGITGQTINPNKWKVIK